MNLRGFQQTYAAALCWHDQNQQVASVSGYRDFPFSNFCSLVGSNAEDGVIIVKSLCGIAHVRTCDGVEDIQIVLNVWTFAEARTAKIGQCHDKDLGRKLRKNQGTEKSRSNVKKLHAVWKSANKFRFEGHEFRTEDTDAHLCVFKQLFNKLSDMNPVIFSFQIDTDIVMLEYVTDG